VHRGCDGLLSCHFGCRIKILGEKVKFATMDAH
jgi:hypothetical protein